jgi:hypothetical protein
MHYFASKKVILSSEEQVIINLILVGSEIGKLGTGLRKSMIINKLTHIFYQKICLDVPF